MSTLTSFTGSFSFLSNFHPSPVVYERVRYPTVEHAYQAAKTTSVRQRAAIRKCPTPAQAKKIGRHLHVRDGWDDMKVEVMRGLLEQKFRNPTYRVLLNTTRGLDLVHGNTHGDRFWGVVDGVGENMLGKLIMQIRDKEKPRH